MFRELTFLGTGSVKTWKLTMYLTPDQRFLAGDLLDTTLDPVVEQRRKEEEVVMGLVPNKGASRGLDQAQVTIVESQ